MLARVAAGTLSLGSAAAVMAVSYRQAKRQYRRYRAEGAQGLQHRSAGRRSNAARNADERERILALVREKYAGTVDERFGPTLAAEHLASEDGVLVYHDTCGAERSLRACGIARGNAVRTDAVASAKGTLASWCNSMAAFIRGLSLVGRRVAC